MKSTIQPVGYPHDYGTPPKSGWNPSCIWPRRAAADEVGVNFGITSQIATMALLAVVVLDA